MAMAKQEEDNYWTSSVTKGFDFDSEENQDNFSELFGVTHKETAQLSKQVKEITSNTRAKPSSSPSSSTLSLNSDNSSSSIIRTSQPNKNYLVTNKLLSTTIHVESVLSPKDVVRSLFLGMSVDLHYFKKLTDKTALLDEAVRLGDGDVIVAVLLYLQRTLHQSVLFSVLINRQVAADQYIDMLEKQNCYKEAAVLCSQMKRSRQAAVHLYANTLKEKKKDLSVMLQQLLKNELNALTGIEMEAEIVNEHIQLLERQKPIAGLKRNEIESGKLNLSRSPLVGSPVQQDQLLGSSLLETLQYCCRFHWNTPENLLVSPAAMKSTFAITDRQFAWNACLGKLLAGGDPLPVLVTKGLFGSPKIVAGLSISRVLEIVWKMDGPSMIFDQLLPLIESSQLRCQLAKRYHRHRIVIDVLTSNKDRLALLRYRDSVNDAAVVEYVNNILKVSSTRWKN